jgi:hypothetical protein
MNPFEFVLAIIIITGVFQILRHRLGVPERRSGRRGIMHEAVPEDSAETRMLRDEVRTLKERIQVLERITVEKENSLSREIEDLRNK